MIASSLAAGAVIEIVLLLYVTFKNIFKKTEDSFVLKDQYTIYFVTLSVIGLLFKVLILDALMKQEITTRNSCSMFLSTYVPEFFVTLAYTCIAIKSLFLILNIRDTSEIFQQRNAKRKKIADISLGTYLALIMIVMFLRCVNTCQRDKVGVQIEKIVPWIASRNLVGVITILKSLPLLMLIVALSILRTTEYFKPLSRVVALALT